MRRRTHTLKGRSQSVQGMSWWRAELREWVVCVVRPFNLHVVKHEVLLACHGLRACRFLESPPAT